jgi:hypothetical protein
MKVKITLDRNAFSSSKTNALTKIIRDLGSKATVSGDTITVESGWDEKKVIDILCWERVNYSVSH